MSLGLGLGLNGNPRGGTPPVDPATSVQLYTRSGDTILDRAGSIIERRSVDVFTIFARDETAVLDRANSTIERRAA